MVINKMKMKTKITSIRMNPELWKKFKIYCLMNNIDASSEVCKLVAKKVEEKELIINKFIKDMEE